MYGSLEGVVFQQKSKFYDISVAFGNHKQLTMKVSRFTLLIHLQYLKPVTPVKESASPSSDKSSNVPQVLSALPPLRTLVQVGYSGQKYELL